MKLREGGRALWAGLPFRQQEAKVLETHNKAGFTNHKQAGCT